MDRLAVRRYILVTIGIAGLLYSSAVLWTVWDHLELGVQCLFADVPPPGIKESGPQVGLVDAEAEIVGPRPVPGDYLVRLAGEPVPTFMHFKHRAAEIDPPYALPPGPVLRNKQELYSPARQTTTAAEDLGGQWQLRGDLPPLVEIAGQRWAQAEFLRPVERKGQSGAQRIVCWLKLQPVSTTQLLRSFVWFQLVLVILAIGALVTFSRPADRATSLFFALCGVHAITFLGAFHWPSLVGNRLLSWPFVVAALLLAPLTLHFYFLFPHAWPLFQRWRPQMLVVLYALPVVWSALMIVTMYQISQSFAAQAATADLIGQLDRLTLLIYSYLAASVVMFVISQGLVVYTFIRSQSAAERAEARLLVGALLVASIPVGSLIYLANADRAAFAYGPVSRWMTFAISLLFIVSHAISISRYKLMPLAKMLNRGMVYVAISFGVTALFCLMVGMITTLVGQYFFRWENALAAGLTAMAVVVLLGLVRDRFQQAVDRRFSRQKIQLDRAMQRLSAAVEQLVEPADLARQMLYSALDAVGAKRGAVLLRREPGGRFELASAAGAGWETLDLDGDGPLPAALRGEGVLKLRPPLAATWQRPLLQAGTSVAFALEFDDQILGIALLGPKDDEAAYTDEDANFLLALARTTALALHSAQGRQTIESLQERLADKIEKIAEQQRWIRTLQGELLGNRPPATPEAAAAAELPAASETLQHDIRGTGPAVQQMLAQVAKIARTQSSVLIRGESGTGKELLAQAIHQNSPRAASPFVAVHCAAFNAGVLESELFGHVKGAFTGADRDKVGRFELASGGTLFLDEIGDINLETQTKLLRVLQQRTFERVGGTQSLAADVRLIAATHRPLEQLIRRGLFREDLFYRLNVISLVCPPLRERREDIFELALHFLRNYAPQAGKLVVRIEDDAFEALLAYDWPGNIRQLENAIERSVVLADGDAIRLEDLPSEVRGIETPSRRSRLRAVPAGVGRLAAGSQPRFDADQAGHDSLSDEVATHERQRIEAALAACGGNKSQAAKRLGIPRSTLFSKLRRLGIE
ncbi:MAG: sigma 54-interacting transcriptional regulator [Pirellulales bacterium]|nr:sigma 54-interacting transcriptional regulator [Pirellulales bacterium]